jgi:hypothetical protein
MMTATMITVYDDDDDGGSGEFVVGGVTNDEDTSCSCMLDDCKA